MTGTTLYERWADKCRCGHVEAEHACYWLGRDAFTGARLDKLVNVCWDCWKGGHRDRCPRFRPALRTRAIFAPLRIKYAIWHWYWDHFGPTVTIPVIREHDAIGGER